MKKILMNLLMVCILLANGMFVNAQEQTEYNNEVFEDGIEYTNEYFKAKFNEVFPEYVERIEECDALAMQATNNVTNGISVLSLNDDEAVVTEKLTRYEEDDMYSLTFYSDGGYSEVALLSETTSVEFEFGTELNATYTNCKVYTYLSDPGFPVTYSGGIIGDGISFYKYGGFMSSGYGNYINAVEIPDISEEEAFILSKTNTSVKVVGQAYGVLGSGKYEAELTKQTLLQINLVSGARPNITFGYL